MTRYVTFYTAGTPYHDEAKELRRTCEQHGVQIAMFEYPTAGSWVRNCAMKPRAIYTMMQAFPEYDIVWLDADARMMAKPDWSIVPKGTSLAAHMLDGQELLSGTLWVSRDAENVVEQWMRACMDNPDVWDQRHLQSLIGDRLFCLPESYCAIFDRNVPNPVIVHTQASRRLK